MTDFPFTFYDVLSALKIPIRKIRGNEIQIDCPECVVQKKRKATCQIRVDKNVFNCPACGNFKGTITQFYSYFTGCTTKEANKIMRSYVKNPTTVEQRKFSQEAYKKAVESAPKLVKLAPKSVINRTYRTLLSLCVLRKEHKENLIKRGLTEKQIEHFGFKSVPWKNETDSIVKQLLDKGCTLMGVPGFYCEHGKWKMAVSYKNRGFFVPMLNIHKQCLGMQIRKDTPDPKYLWFSSNGYENGCNRTSIPGFSNFWHIGKSVCITEGGLKADVAHAHSGITFVGIAGVTQFSVLPILFKYLRQAGVTTIADCFDMDYKTNPNVQQARKRLKAEIINAGFRYVRYEWDENYKGIDDYFTAVPAEQRHMIAVK